MGVLLERADGESLRVSAWNWGVLHYVVAEAEVLDVETTDALHFGGMDLTAKEVAVLVGFLEMHVLPRLQPGQRLLYDLTVTDEPDDGAFLREHLDKAYGLRHEVLVRIIAFLRGAEGPVSVW